MPDDCSHRLASVSRGTSSFAQVSCGAGLNWAPGIRLLRGLEVQGAAWQVWWPDPSLGRPAERGVRKIDKKRRGGALRGSPCQRGPMELDYADPRTAHSSITASQHSASYLLQQALGWSPGAPVIGAHGVGLLCHSCFCVPFSPFPPKGPSSFSLCFSFLIRSPLLVSWSRAAFRCRALLGNQFLVARCLPRLIP